MVHRIAGSDGVDVDPGLSECVRYARQCAGPVIEKDRELFCDLHKSVTHSKLVIEFSFHTPTILDSFHNRQSEIGRKWGQRSVEERGKMECWSGRFSC